MAALDARPAGPVSVRWNRRGTGTLNPAWTWARDRGEDDPEMVNAERKRRKPADVSCQ
jgi:hypothetical protein